MVFAVRSVVGDRKGQRRVMFLHLNVLDENVWGNVQINLIFLMIHIHTYIYIYIHTHYLQQMLWREYCIENYFSNVNNN